jgi:hypothetical protein
MEVETSSHALWWCRATSAVWAERGGRLKKCAIEERGFLNIFEHLSHHLECEDMELVALIA